MATMNAPPNTPTRLGSHVATHGRPSRMEAWWREGYEFPIELNGSPNYPAKSDFEPTPVRSVAHHSSIFSTVSAPTPDRSTWADTPTRRAVSNNATPATGDDDSTPSFNRMIISPNMKAVITKFGKAIHDSNISKETKDFIRQALKLRYTRGESLDSLDFQLKAILANLGEDSALNSTVVVGLLCSEMSTLTTNASQSSEQLKKAIEKLPYKLRADRHNQKLTDENSQGIFPPEACLFVGNLQKEETDQRLRHLVYAAMRVYGDCNVRMTRDNNQIPTAFVQYWDVEYAKLAINDVSNIRPISGRVPRIEQARVQRELYVCHHDRTPVTLPAIHGLMENQGPFAHVTYPSAKAIKCRGLAPGGVVVEFCTFGDYNDTHKSNFNSNPNILTYPWAEEAIRKHHSRNSSHTSTPFAEVKPTAVIGSFDARSVFVGNLNRDTTIFELKALFSEAGVVINIHIAKNTSKRGALATYAFVEFAHPTAVWVAVMMHDGRVHRNLPMRVQIRKNLASGRNVAAAQVLFSNPPPAVMGPCALGPMMRGVEGMGFMGTGDYRAGLMGMTGMEYFPGWFGGQAA